MSTIIEIENEKKARETHVLYYLSQSKYGISRILYCSNNSKTISKILDSIVSMSIHYPNTSIAKIFRCTKRESFLKYCVIYGNIDKKLINVNVIRNISSKNKKIYPIMYNDKLYSLNSNSFNNYKLGQVSHNLKFYLDCVNTSKNIIKSKDKNLVKEYVKNISKNFYDKYFDNNKINKNNINSIVKKALQLQLKKNIENDYEKNMIYLDHIYNII